MPKIMSTMDARDSQITQDLAAAGLPGERRTRPKRRNRPAIAETRSDALR